MFSASSKKENTTSSKEFFEWSVASWPMLECSGSHQKLMWQHCLKNYLKKFMTLTAPNLPVWNCVKKNLKPAYFFLIFDKVAYMADTLGKSPKLRKLLESWLWCQLKWQAWSKSILFQLFPKAEKPDCNCCNQAR